MARKGKTGKNEMVAATAGLVADAVWHYVIPELKDWLKDRRKERSETKKKEALLAALDQALQGSLNLLLFLDRTSETELWYSAEGLLPFAPLIGAGLVDVVDSRPKPEESGEAERARGGGLFSRPPQNPPASHEVLPHSSHRISLSEAGWGLVNAWRNRDAETCLKLLESRQAPTHPKEEE